MDRQDLKKKLIEYMKSYDTNAWGYQVEISEYGVKSFDSSFLAEISKSEDINSWDDFKTYLSDEYDFDYWLKEESYEFKERVKKDLDVSEDLEDYVDEWIDENVGFVIDYDVYDQNIHVAIALDVGDANFDFTNCNILNYYSGRDYKSTFGAWEDQKECSPIYWLAKQQGKLEELEKVLKKYDYCENLKEEFKDISPFTKSVISEFQNLSSHMGTLTFLVSMPLSRYLELKEAIKEEEPLNNSYYYDERKGDGYITISKDTECGLFDAWQGGGSVLEIALEKDVDIPFKAIWTSWIDVNKGCPYGYSVDEVYGLTDEAWRGSLVNHDSSFIQYNYKEDTKHKTR